MQKRKRENQKPRNHLFAFYMIYHLYFIIKLFLFYFFKNQSSYYAIKPDIPT